MSRTKKISSDISDIQSDAKRMDVVSKSASWLAERFKHIGNSVVDSVLERFVAIGEWYKFDSDKWEQHLRSLPDLAKRFDGKPEEREKWISKQLDEIYRAVAPSAHKYTNLNFKEKYTDDDKKHISQGLSFLEKILEMLKKIYGLLKKGLQYLALFALTISVLILVMVCLTGKNFSKLLKAISEMFYRTYDSIKKAFFRAIEGASRLSPSMIIENVIKVFREYLDGMLSLWEGMKNDGLDKAFAWSGVCFFLSVFALYSFVIS